MPQQPSFYILRGDAGGPDLPPEEGHQDKVLQQSKTLLACVEAPESVSDISKFGGSGGPPLHGVAATQGHPPCALSPCCGTSRGLDFQGVLGVRGCPLASGAS